MTPPRAPGRRVSRGRVRGFGPESGHRRGGYVLIEAVAALVVAMLLLSFAYPLVARGTSPARLLALASSAAALLRDARTAAAVAGHPVAARFDAGRRTLAAGAVTVAIPSDVAFSLTAGGHCRTEGGGAAVLFRPDGSGCGAVLRFARGAKVLRARVNWADGHVDIVEGG